MTATSPTMGLAEAADTIPLGAAAPQAPAEEGGTA